MKIYGIDGKMNLVGGRIRSLREERKLTQSELAARLQLMNVIVEQKAISRIELGTRLVADYELLAFSRIFNVSLEWLLTGTAAPCKCGKEARHE